MAELAILGILYLTNRTAKSWRSQKVKLATDPTQGDASGFQRTDAQTRNHAGVPILNAITTPLEVVYRVGDGVQRDNPSYVNSTIVAGMGAGKRDAWEMLQDVPVVPDRDVFHSIGDVRHRNLTSLEVQARLANDEAAVTPTLAAAWLAGITGDRLVPHGLK